MGLLDDAIREHLDLKRRRGADPAEVERAEREALGPVRRGPEEPSLALHPDDGAATYVEPPAAYDQQSAVYDEPESAEAYEGSHDVYDDDEDGWGELTREHATATDPAPYADDEYDDEGDLYATDEHAAPAAGVAPEFEEPASGAASPETPTPQKLRFTSDQAASDEDPLPHAIPSDPADAVRPDEPPAGGGETVEYDVERAMQAEPVAPAADEDVLEETPEFLQDTPDHDRLWFEQKPPRDFDFDG